MIIYAKVWLWFRQAYACPQDDFCRISFLNAKNYIHSLKYWRWLTNTVKMSLLCSYKIKDLVTAYWHLKICTLSAPLPPHTLAFNPMQD